MTIDLDIYRAAHALNAHHGADAPIQTAMKADAMLDAGDVEDQAVWRRILAAVDDLVSTDRPERAGVHLPQN
jgi:hypothetical protein